MYEPVATSSRAQWLRSNVTGVRKTGQRAADNCPLSHSMQRTPIRRHCLRSPGPAPSQRTPYTGRMDRLWTPWRYAYITGAQRDARKGVPETLAGWPGDRHCVFCNMIAAHDWALGNGMPRAEADRAIFLLEHGDLCFTVLNGYPYNNGHLMVVPYQHQASLAALPLPVAEEMMRMARRAERALRQVYTPDGLNLGMNLGESAGAGVADHLHLHALPRWTGDTNFMTVVAETRILPEMLDGSWHRLRQALAALPAEMAAGVAPPASPQSS